MSFISLPLTGFLKHRKCSFSGDPEFENQFSKYRKRHLKYSKCMSSLAYLKRTKVPWSEALIKNKNCVSRELALSIILQ